MTDPTGSTTQTTHAWDGHNVIAVSFEDDRNAYSAMTALKQLDGQGRVGVGEAVVVMRGDDGQLVAKDSVEPPALLDETDSALGGISTSVRLDHTAMELWFRSLL